MSHNQVPDLDDENHTETSFSVNCSDFRLEVPYSPPTITAPTSTDDSSLSKDSGYESDIPVCVRSVRWEESEEMVK